MIRQLSTRFISPKLFHPIIKPCIFTSHPIYSYHMSYLMDSKHDDKFVKIDRRAFHLYKDSILKLNNGKFNEKIFLLIVIDSVRTKQKYQDFQQLAEYGISKIEQFTQLLSVFAFVTQLYLYNYPNKQLAYKVAKKAFDLIRQQPNIQESSFYTVKFLIFIEKCVGLEKFPDQAYSLINFNHFKPLYLCFTLEMFYEHNLQHYSIVENIMDIFTSSSSIIPFADIHHYKLAVKKITHPKFREFINQLQNHLMKNRESSSVSRSTNQEFNNEIQSPEHKNKRQDNHHHQQVQNSKNKQMNLQASTQVQSNKHTQFPWQQTYIKDVQRRYNYFPSFSSRASSK